MLPEAYGAGSVEGRNRGGRNEEGAVGVTGVVGK